MLPITLIATPDARSGGMTVQDQGVLEMFDRVLIHYSKKAKEATLGDESKPRTGKAFFDADVRAIDEEIQKFKEELKVSHYSREFADAIGRHRKLASDAFSVYIADLKRAKVDFEKALGASPMSNNFDRELEFVERYVGQIP
jgi:hypothetical protein